MASYDYDLFVIGGGSGGVRAARVSSQLGGRVALAEEKHLGGTCVNVGCVPKKLLVYGSHYQEDFEDARGFGWSLPGTPSFDWSRLLANKDAEIARLLSDSGEVRAMMLTLGALAKVQAAAGVIPEVSGAFLHRAAMEIQVDPGGLAQATGSNGVTVPGLVAAMRQE